MKNPVVIAIFFFLRQETKLIINSNDFCCEEVYILCIKLHPIKKNKYINNFFYFLKTY